MSTPAKSSAKILVVDDVAENRDLLLRRLQRLGIDDVDQAENGMQALAALAKKSYDLMLLDIMMPELDGFGVLDALRKSGHAADVPIIVISAMNEMDAIVRCIESGAEDFLLKPFNPVMLRARVTSSLEKKLLRDRTRDELRRKQAELNEARTLQLALEPAPFHGIRGGRSISLRTILEPAKEVGGDLVDHFLVGDDLVVFLIGDVSDKGAGAALMMARTHSMFRGLSTRPDAYSLFSDPAKAVNIVNAALALNNDSCMFVTFFLASLNPSTLELKYVRAGHVPPFRWHGDGAVTRIETASGPPLGLVENYQYKQDATVLSADENVLVVTDGFTEANDSSGTLFGESRIIAHLASASMTISEALTSLVRNVHEFEAGQSQSDDMAAVLLSFDAPVQAATKFEAEVLARAPDIAALAERVGSFLDNAGVDVRATHHVAMIVDELLTNLGTHGGVVEEPAAIRILIEPDRVKVEVNDSGSPFDPRSAPDPNLSTSVEDREIGGLGLFLMRKIATDLYYARDGGHNLTSFAVLRSSE